MLTIRYVTLRYVSSVNPEAVEELEVDGRIAAVETGRVAKGVEERVELFVGGSTVEELEVNGRVASVEQRRRKLIFIGKAKTTPMWVCPDHFR